VPSIGPAVVLSVLVGIFVVSLYVLLRGRTQSRLPFVVGASILGAWAGDAVGGLAGISVLSVGDFHVPAAVLGAAAGIAIVELLSVLAAPKPEGPPGP
jgi:outer membrane lipoprotein SlyB